MSSLTAPQPLADPIQPRARHPMHAQLALIGGGCLTSLLVSCADPTTSTTRPAPQRLGDLAGPQRDLRAPWPAPDDTASGVTAAGLDLGPMGTAEHYHPHVRIIIDGVDVPVAANIGVDRTTGAMSALHTHESDGSIHIERDRLGDVFTLSQLFTEWGVTHRHPDRRRPRRRRPQANGDQQPDTRPRRSGRSAPAARPADRYPAVCRWPVIPDPATSSPSARR
jgi:hypothetical protein